MIEANHSQYTRASSWGRDATIEVKIYREYGYAFDNTNHNWDPNHSYNAAYLRSMMDWLNTRFTMRGFLFLNEALEAMGFEATPGGQVVGWHKEEGTSVDIKFALFDLQDESGNKTGEKRHWITFKPHGVIVNRI